MRAWVLHGIGDLRYEEVDEPELLDNEVLISVKAAGICGSDIPRIYKNGAHKMPLILGHEFSGIVAKTGKAVKDNWQGKRVGVFPLIPCNSCVSCQKSQYEMCGQYSYLGSRRNGGFAEFVAVPEWNLIELPQNVSYEEAAMLEPMAVAVHAMRRIELMQTDNVVVCGLGTIGQLLVMFLLENGIRNIFVIGNKDSQKMSILKMGVPEDNYCDSKTQDIKEWLMNRNGSQGIDVFFECVGKNATISRAVDLTAPAGKICLVGNPYSDLTLQKDVYWKILRNQLSITGTWNSSYVHKNDDDWQYVLQKLEEKRIAPANLVSHRLSLEGLGQGFEIMRDKSEEYIKIMMTWS